MRLIDADELTILFEDLINHHTEDLKRHKDIPQKYKSRIEGKIDGVVACGMDLITMPTVKAIPIEWIEKWGWKNGMSESMSLRVMIDDWEKENEHKESD